jgi:hypothetical protein
MSDPTAWSVDREGWPAGPWDGEPDRIEWRHRGLPCLIVRNGNGALCGYAGVPPRHPWHGLEYDGIDADVHGGLTYAAACAGHICHVPAPGEPDDVWWLGFDCGHAFDITPRFMSPALAEIIRRSPLEHAYHTIDYVKAEVERLADQALAAVLA